MLNIWHVSRACVNTNILAVADQCSEGIVKEPKF